MRNAILVYIMTLLSYKCTNHHLILRKHWEDSVAASRDWYVVTQKCQRTKRFCSRVCQNINSQRILFHILTFDDCQKLVPPLNLRGSGGENDLGDCDDKRFTSANCWDELVSSCDEYGNVFSQEAGDSFVTISRFLSLFAHVHFLY